MEAPWKREPTSNLMKMEARTSVYDPGHFGVSGTDPIAIQMSIHARAAIFMSDQFVTFFQQNAAGVFPCCPDTRNSHSPWLSCSYEAVNEIPTVDNGYPMVDTQWNKGAVSATAASITEAAMFVHSPAAFRANVAPDRDTRTMLKQHINSSYQLPQSHASDGTRMLLCEPANFPSGCPYSTANFVSSTAYNRKRKQRMSCLFCRDRKIKCAPLDEDQPGQICNVHAAIGSAHTPPSRGGVSTGVVTLTRLAQKNSEFRGFEEAP
ncbi:hypothetical protein B0H14DRAFT_3125542 [Mycena olivaceomarginata]|nr:hypothetical protein B0H14DRAFT_3125542 [Mycena olivaceomarginata]